MELAAFDEANTLPWSMKLTSSDIMWNISYFWFQIIDFQNYGAFTMKRDKSKTWKSCWGECWKGRRQGWDSHHTQECLNGLVSNSSLIYVCWWPCKQAKVAGKRICRDPFVTPSKLFKIFSLLTCSFCKEASHFGMLVQNASFCSSLHPRMGWSLGKKWEALTL